MKIGELEFGRYWKGGWRGYVRVGYEGLFGNIAEWLNGKADIVLSAKCRKVLRHETPQGVVYSKLMWAQNDQAITEGLPHKWLKWAFGRSRAVLILKNTSEMIARGHLCPEPLLAVRKLQANGWHLNLLVTAEVKEPTVEALVLGGDEESVRRAGRELALLHADEFVHGDFLPRNSCLGNGKFYFLDNDKSRHWIKAPFFLQRRNLDQFTYNLMYLKGTDCCRKELPMAFLESYAEAAKWDEERKKYEFVRIIEKAEKRWKKEACKNKTSDK